MYVLERLWERFIKSSSIEKAASNIFLYTSQTEVKVNFDPRFLMTIWILVHENLRMFTEHKLNTNTKKSEIKARRPSWFKAHLPAELLFKIIDTR